MQEPQDQQFTKSSIAYSILAILMLFAAYQVFTILLANLERINRNGLFSSIYFILIVVLALVVALFLFGVLKAYASYKGEYFGGVVELGGPSVAFAATIIASLYFMNPSEPFDISIFLYQGDNKSKSFNKGELEFSFGSTRERLKILDDGSVTIKDISPTYLNDSINLFLHEFGYKVSQEKHPINKQLFIQVIENGELGDISGIVRNKLNLEPIKHTLILVGNDSTRTDNYGFFKLKIHPNNRSMKYNVRAIKKGYKEEIIPFTPGSGEMEIRIMPKN